MFLWNYRACTQTFLLRIAINDTVNDFDGHFFLCAKTDLHDQHRAYYDSHETELIRSNQQN